MEEEIALTEEKKNILEEKGRMNGLVQLKYNRKRFLYIQYKAND